MKKLMNKMKTIEIDVILTFCSYKEYGSQEFFDVSLSYDEGDKSARKLLDQRGFFETVVQVCEDYGRLPTELVKISTAANWTKHGFEFDIGNGKWSFGSWGGQNIEWSDNLAKLYGFGRDDDAVDSAFNLRLLHGMLSSKETAAALKKMMSK